VVRRHPAPVRSLTEAPAFKLPRFGPPCDGLGESHPPGLAQAITAREPRCRFAEDADLRQARSGADSGVGAPHLGRDLGVGVPRDLSTPVVRLCCRGLLFSRFCLTCHSAWRTKTHGADISLDGLHITTRFTGVAQLRRVEMPGGVRNQLTFTIEPIRRVAGPSEHAEPLYTAEVG
jgi:hypothetical protein